MPVNNRYEQQFLAALKDIFVGAKVEGDSGYINLMKIKAGYFENGVLPQLMQDIEAAVQPFALSFREELFDKLYDFFKRYFSESGSIYFRQTPLHQNVYEKVYTDGRDVILFWKTHMLYYVKTDRLFHSMDVEVDGTAFFFDVARLEHKRANEKRELVYASQGYKNGKVVLVVSYAEKGRKTKNEEILRALKTQGISLAEETLQRACRVFEKQSEVDYFINKNAKAFLQEQFDLWLYQYLFAGESDFQETRLKQLQALKNIAYRLIVFIAQFEDELVRVWNKPKFVLNSHYLITLDKITDAGLRAKLFSHPQMAAQVAEWQALGLVGGDFRLEMVQATNLLGEPANGQYQYLPLDTRYFADLELEILGLFDDLDAALDGWLVHSENYQALNTLLPKFRECVKAIYIDPPYNAEGSEILYENDYRTSSWLTLMDNRLDFIPEYLQKGDSALVIAIDDFENDNLLGMLKQKFLDYDVNSFVINHHPQGSPKANISRTHEYSVMVTPKSTDFVRVPRAVNKSNERPFMRTGTGNNNFRYGRPNSFYAILVDPTTSTIQGLEEPPKGTEYPTENTAKGYARIYPIDGKGNERVWRKSYKSAVKAIAQGIVFSKQNSKNVSIHEKVFIERVKPTSNWFDSKYNAGTHGTSLLTNLFGNPGLFSYPKSISSVVDFVDAIVYDDDEATILDFFAGSGTTAHAVINLNRADGGKRKYILVEMGEHFHSVILPRIKKVIFSDKWKDGRAQPGQGISHFAKYYALEQYEGSLRRARYADAPLLAAADAYHSYVFLRDLKMLEAISLDKEQNKVDVHLDKLYPNIDLAETLSCVSGKGIRRITAETVEFQDGSTASLAAPDWEWVRPLVWW